jgi:uncharacterized membrane protein
MAPNPDPNPTPFSQRTSKSASGIAAVLVTGTWLALLLLNFPSDSSNLWLAVMLFGYIAVVPIVSMLFDEEEEAESDAPTGDAENSESEDALERLRRRYAEGELTDEQFERKLDRLLETETLEDAEDRARARQHSETESGDRITERE